MPTKHDLTTNLPDVADYDLVEEVGRGSMGIVYRAWQRSADREVALKVVRADILAGLPVEKQNETLERFRTEALATAQLEHDNIVTVYEVGEWEGQPFFSMRFVKGRSLAEALHDGPMENRRAAEYVEPLCRAIHEAHEHGILHRDLKPQNFMLDEASDRALVADFGLAKLLEGEAELTRDGEVMGTPQYMSPEQATNSAQTSTQSDVYGLGATLYHLLTGRPPFQAVTALETLQRVITEEPLPPRQLVSSVDRDLETICLKCLDKEPARRYDSAEALADELKRYLDGMPILARPIGKLGHVWRWCRRNPAIAVLSMGLAVSVIVALFAVSAGYYQTVQAHKRSERGFRQARQAVNNFFTQVSEDALLDQPGLQPLRKDLLHQALGFYLAFLDERGDDPALREEVAATYYRVGRVTMEIDNSPEKSLDWYRKARKLQQEMVDQHPDDVEILDQLGDTLNAEATAIARMGELDKALPVFDDARIARNKLVEKDADQSDYIRKLANTLMNIGLVEKNRFQFQRAKGHMEDAQRLRKKSLGSLKDDPTVLRDLGKGFYNLARLALDIEDYDVAERLLESAPDGAIASYQRLLELAGDRTVVHDRYLLAVCFRLLGDVKEDLDAAAAAYVNAAEVLRMLHAQNPAVEIYQVELAEVLFHQGNLAQDRDRSEEVSESFDSAENHFRQLVEGSSGDRRYQLGLALVLKRQGQIRADQDREQARANLAESVKLLKTVFEKDPDNTNVSTQLREAEELLGDILQNRDD